MRFFISFALCLACVSTAFAAIYTFKADFTEERDSLPNAELGGFLYYLYNETNTSNSRLRLEYNLDGILVSNLYHYGLGAMYSMCSANCSADTIKEKPDPWWFSSTIYEKTSQQESGMFWYTRKTSVDRTVQVSRILMSDSTTPASGSVKAIEFSDGKKIRLSNFVLNPSDVPATSAKFQTDPGLNCPVPTCSMYADIVFVLDFSGSVSSKEWSQTAEFVIKVLNSFTFGDYAAAAAIVKFTTSASILASASGIGGQSVSTNRTYLINVINKTLTPSGGTFLGSGLNLAAQIFDRSPRSRNGVKPHNITIFVTDGEDNSGYPARTKTAADNLKGTKYDAFLMGIGVGINSQSARKVIESLSSDMAGGKAYFGVTEYNKIKDAADKIFNPLCDEYHSECGPYCHGFCGCGECLCPKCVHLDSKCSENKCSVSPDGTSSTGCETKPKVTCDPDDKCTQHVCNNENGQCEDKKTCQAVIDKNKGSCRTVTCDSKDGSCHVNLDDSVCKRFNTKCETWKCAPENQTPMDAETGCTITENKTAKCIEKGKDTCLDYTCDMNNGDCVYTDTCPGLNTKCVTYECIKGNDNKYSCVGTEVPGPSNTSCATYICDPAEGWKTFSEETPETCANDTDPCKVFGCDPKRGGCYMDVKTQCDEKCKDWVGPCKQYAAGNSTVDKCLAGTCLVKGEPGSGNTVPYCDFNETNCLESDAAKEAEENNANSSEVCYTVECKDGGCRIVKLEKEVEDTKCMKNVCEKYAAGWHWVYKPTEANTTCISDKCHSRVCVPDVGCVPTDICEANTTQCITYTCVTQENGVKECASKEYNYATTPCMYEKCSDDGQRVEKVFVVEKDELNKVCNNSDKCIQMICSDDGECVPTETSPGVRDPCQVYSCDPASGWNSTPKCTDGLFCTVDHCSLTGDCWYTPINCNQELDMTDYPCFVAECKEADGRHRCHRKKKDGVYIDVCGNCLREDGVETSFSEDESLVTACIEAPEEPMLKEGLAAATIGMIVLLAVLVGGAITASTVIGTKTLLERARAADNQSAHSNPLFEDNRKVLQNPTFMEEVEME